MLRLMVFMFLLGGAAPVAMAEQYLVTGEVKGSFCRYFGFVCKFQNVDAVSFGDDQMHAITHAFPDVSDFKADPGTPDRGRCWIRTQTDQQTFGWLAVLKDYVAGVPTFYAAKDDGTYDVLGTPEFVVFPCIRVPA
jgi:hypothetical protein